jgi:hypothetical protein
MKMKIQAWAAFAAMALTTTGCAVHDMLFGFKAPTITVAGTAPIEMTYREGTGGLVILTGRVNDAADVDFILDTGAPVTVLLDGTQQTAPLKLDTSKAVPLGDPKDPATPVGVIQDGFKLKFGAIDVTGLTAVLIQAKALPCQERFTAINFGGVIGADLFKRFVVEIDPTAKRVRFHEPKDWIPPAGVATIPLSFEGGGHIYIDAQVKLATGNEVPMRLNFDSGMNKGLMLVAGGSSAIPMPTSGETKKACYANGVRDELRGPPVDLRMGAIATRVAAPTYASRENTTAVQRAGAFGIEAFKGRRLFIDYPSKRLGVSD